MDSFFHRYRNLLVLLVILLAQIIGLAVQVRRTDRGRNTLDPGDMSGVRLIRLWADAGVTPPEQLFHTANLGAGSLWQNYLDLRSIREQNRICFIMRNHTSLSKDLAAAHRRLGVFDADRLAGNSHGSLL